MQDTNTIIQKQGKLVTPQRLICSRSPHSLEKENCNWRNLKYKKVSTTNVVDIQKLAVQQKVNSNKNFILNREIEINLDTNKKENFEKTREKLEKVETTQRQGKTITKQEKEKKKLQKMISIIDSFEFPENFKLTEASKTLWDDLKVQC